MKFLRYSVKNVVQTQAPQIVEIDLGQRSNSLVSTGTISFEKRLVGQHNNIAKIWVTPDTITPNGLRFSKNIPLLVITKVDSKHLPVVDVEKVQSVDYSIILQTEAIVDCINRDQQTFELRYTLHIKLENGDKKHHEDGDKEYQQAGVVVLRLKPISCHPVLSIDNPRATYDLNPIRRTLLIQNSSVKEYAPTLEMRVDRIYLLHNNPDGTNRPYDHSVEPLFGEARQTVRWNPGNVRLENGNPQLVRGNVIRYIHPCKNVNDVTYRVEVPIELDLSQLQNPMAASETYQVVIEYDYWEANNPNNQFQNKTTRLDFTVLRNEAQHDMKVRFLVHGPNGYVVNRLVNHGENRVINPNSSFDVRRQGERRFSLSVADIAAVQDARYPNAGVWIRNFRHDQDMDGATAYAGHILLTVDDLVEDSLHGVGVNPQGITMLRATQAIDIHLDVPDLAALRIDRFAKNGEEVFEVFVKHNLRFQYFIAETGNETPDESKWKDYEAAVMFKFEIPPAPEWMVVDFGTSAVVALYGNIQDDGQGNINEPPIADLVTRKRQLLFNAYGPGSGYSEVSEQGRFIDSDIQKNVSGTVNEDFNDQNYKEASFLFSPGKQLDYTQLLPSLKSLMGHERIPSMNGDPAVQPPVDDLYKTVYRELFDLYLSKVSNGASIEKIILTYPNTFASIHVQKLKDLAQACIPSLRVIETLSESDAIVYRYLSYTRNVYGLNAHQDQHVLVYDMGAGTLDITYFSNILDADGVRNVNILGKYGISKAGNYLDYVLADIVVQILEEKLEITKTTGGTPLRNLLIDWNNNRNVNVPMDERKTLKQYVKNILKPMMSEYVDEGDGKLDGVMMPGGFMKDLEQVPLKEVFKQLKFKDFIKEVSQGVIASCRSNFINNNGPVDFLVFSGRMTRMKCIRKAVREALDPTRAKLVCLDICHHGANELPDINELKTSVVLGAFDRVGYLRGNTNYRVSQSRPFFCRYAIVVNRNDGRKELRCILDANTPGQNQYNAREDVDLTGAIMITLVQTYAVEPNAILADYGGDRDVTTPLFAEEVRGQNGMCSVVVQVEVPADGQNEQGNQSVSEQGNQSVRLWIEEGGVQREIARLPHENLESRAFRMSAWPVELA